MLIAKKGISTLQMHRVVFGEGSGSAYHTTWYMCHRWRSAMKSNAIKLTGEVEVDETFIGGKEKNKHKSRRNGSSGTTAKVAVFGAIARKGMVIAKVIENTDTETLNTFVHQSVAEDVSLVATDEHSGYRPLKMNGYPHT